MTATALLREAWRTARASRAYSLLFGAIALVVVLVVVTLVGQAEAQRAGVSAAFNQPEFRTVEIIDQQGVGVVPWSMADRALGISSVEQAWVLGPAFDVTNGAFPEGGRTSGRMFAGDWADVPIRLTSGRLPQTATEALLDDESAAHLGMDASGGWAQGPAGTQWAVVGTYIPLHARAPSTLLVPFDEATEARSVTVTTHRLSQVQPTSAVVASLTGASGPGQLSVETSGDAEELDLAISTTVGRHGVVIVVTVMATSLVILSFLSVLMVHSRRQEFGRRRALGATRGAIIALVVLQGGVVVTIAAVAGLVLGVAVTWARFGHVAPVSFLLTLLVTTVTGSAVAQIPSAVAAGLRDPVAVLRTP